MKFTDINIQFIKWYHKLFLWIIPTQTMITDNLVIRFKRFNRKYYFI